MAVEDLDLESVNQAHQANIYLRREKICVFEEVYTVPRIGTDRFQWRSIPGVVKIPTNIWSTSGRSGFKKLDDFSTQEKSLPRMEAANSLLEELTASSKGGISIVQLYKLGVILDQAAVCTEANDTRLVRLHDACREVLLSTPTFLWETLESALTMVLSQPDDDNTYQTSIGSLAQLYRYSDQQYPSPSLVTQELLPQARKNSTLQSSVLSCLVEFIMKERDFEVFVPVVCEVQQEDEGLLWNPLVSLLSQRHGVDWKKTVVSHFVEEHQDYLMSILDRQQQQHSGTTEAQALHQAVSSVQASSENKKQARKTATTSPEEELTRRIGEVRSILPDFGEGFIEAALSHYQGNVEATVAGLLEAEWPASLRQIDRHLPRRLRNTMSLELDETTKALLKANLQATTRREEEEAMKLDVVLKSAGGEYNDDYDDQYDDLDGGANVDQPEDYESIRVYNRVLKGVVAEQSFWDENRNTNREQKKPKAQPGKAPDANKTSGDGNEAEETGDTNDKKYRGPDKMRGGRIPGRGRGRGGRGRGGSAEQDNNEEASKEQAPGKKPNLKSKQRKLDKRRDQQKKAQQKRNG